MHARNLDRTFTTSSLRSPSTCDCSLSPCDNSHLVQHSLRHVIIDMRCFAVSFSAMDYPSDRANARSFAIVPSDLAIARLGGVWKVSYWGYFHVVVSWDVTAPQTFDLLDSAIAIIRHEANGYTASAPGSLTELRRTGWRWNVHYDTAQHGGEYTLKMFLELGNSREMEQSAQASWVQGPPRPI